MKKKVALLLVLAMVMSILPMNVFGNPVGPQGHLTPLVGTQGPARNLNVHLNLDSFLPSDFVPVTGALGWFATDLRLNLHGIRDNGDAIGPAYLRFPSNRSLFPATHDRSDTMDAAQGGGPVSFTRVTPDGGQSFVRDNPMRWATRTAAELQIPSGGEANGLVNLSTNFFAESRVIASGGGLTPAAISAQTANVINVSTNPIVNIMGQVTQALPARFGTNVPITVNWANEQSARLTMFLYIGSDGATPGTSDIFGLPNTGHVTFTIPVVANHNPNSHNARLRVGMGGWIAGETGFGRQLLDQPILSQVQQGGVNVINDGGRVPFHSALALREIRVQERLFGSIENRIGGTVVTPGTAVPSALRFTPASGTNLTTWAQVDTFVTANAATPGMALGVLDWIRTDTNAVLSSQNVTVGNVGTGGSNVTTIQTWIGLNPIGRTWNDLPFNFFTPPTVGTTVTTNGLFSVRLEADVFYSWALNNDGWPVDPHNVRSLRVTSQLNSFAAIPTTDQLNRQEPIRRTLTGEHPDGHDRVPVMVRAQWESVNDRGVALTIQGRENLPVDQVRHVLYIDVENTDRQLFGIVDRLNINGLWLLPEDRAAATGNVNIVASHGHTGLTDWHANSTGQIEARRGSILRPQLEPRGDNLMDDSRARVLHVGERTGTELGLELIEAPRDVATGTLGTLQPSGTNPGNPDNQNFAHFRGVHTSTILLQEGTPGSWGTGLVNPTTFEFLLDGAPHPGVRILGARVRLANSDTAFDDNGNARNNARITRGAAANDILNFQGWASALDNSFPVRQGVVNLSQSRLSVFVPSRHVNDVHLRRTLEVRLYLSLEPGYEALYGSDVTVTVGGTGAVNLPAAQRELVVANAVDPISVELPGGVTSIETTLTHRATNTPVSNIVVDVHDATRFTVGSEIWFYVTSDLFGPATDLVLNANTQAIVNPESGLQLGQGRRINQPGSANHGALAFPVYRQATGGTAPAPVIELTDVSISGQLFDGVEYDLVVSGTAVTNNEQNVWQALNPTASAAQLARLNVGVFTSRPYAQPIVTYGGGGMDDAAPEGVLPGPGVVTPAAPSNEIRLWAGMADVAGVVDPFRFITLDSGYRVGFVSARAFAFFVNGNPDTGVNWDSATRTATIYGPNTAGETVTVVMTVGSNIATINGVPQDIATFAGRSGPANSISIQPVGNFIYLPLRFLANAFGYEISSSGGEQGVVTLR